MLGRRDVLTGPRRFYGAASLCNYQCFGSFDIAGTTIRCGMADLSAREKPTNCCPSSSTKIIDFKLPLRKFPVESLACVSFS